MIPVLFARQDSIYKQLGCDVYDVTRNALTWSGGRAGIYHPPCRGWGSLSHMSNATEEEKQLAVWSVQMIRKHGGVLEHPRLSKLWKRMNLPTGRQIDAYGGYTISVDQSWWGHRAQKSTLLYIVGLPVDELPDIPIRFDAITHVITQGIRKGRPGFRSRVPQREREATPEAFAKWLICVAEKCVPPGQLGKNLPIV